MLNNLDRDENSKPAWKNWPQKVKDDVQRLARSPRNAEY